MYRNWGFNLQTVYFGGGTPSLLPPEMIGEILEGIRNTVKSMPVEVTVEVNPETYRYQQFKRLRESGINRISIGVQTFQDRMLKMLGREHSVKDSLQAIEEAFDAGIGNISVDLIYGIQGQTVREIERDLKILEKLPVKHVSAYMLTAYEGTPLGQLVKEKRYFLPDEETVNEMFLIINSFLEERGFLRYEISNWAKTNYQCKHNLFYWEREEFLGIGVSAWSFVKSKRFGNIKNLSIYLKRIKENKKPVEFVEFIDADEEKKEKIFLGLRLRKGIELNLVKGKEEFLKRLENEGLVEIRNGRVCLTPKGVLVSNYISAELI